MPQGQFLLPQCRGSLRVMGCPGTAVLVVEWEGQSIPGELGWPEPGSEVQQLSEGWELSTVTDP